MAMIRADKWMLIVLGSAVKKGATKEEINTLCKAAELVQKYKPTKEDLNAETEFGKFIVNSKERKIAL